MAACKGLSVFLLFLLCYVTMLKLQLNIEDSYVMEEGMRSSLQGLSTGFTIDATLDTQTSGISGSLADDVSWDAVVDASYFWDWVTSAIVPAVYNNNKYNQEGKLPYEKNFMAQYNRVIGGMFLIQKRRLRTNSGPCADGETPFPEGNCGACNTKFDAFYPVCYTDELDESSAVTFGPKAVPESTFDAQAAYAADAGISEGAKTCPPAEEMCPTCLLADKLPRS